MCAEPGPLSFLFSYQRPRTYQFQISQEQRERETTDRKGTPPLPLARLTECLHPSHFTEESNYSLELILVSKDQPGNLQISTHRNKTKLFCAARTSRFIDLLKIPHQQF